MKPLKQRSIPQKTVEITMRGSRWDDGQFSAKFVVPYSVAAEMLLYGLPHQTKKKKQTVAPKEK